MFLHFERKPKVPQQLATRVRKLFILAEGRREATSHPISAGGGGGGGPTPGTE